METEETPIAEPITQPNIEPIADPIVESSSQSGAIQEPVKTESNESKSVKSSKLNLVKAPLPDSKRKYPLDIERVAAAKSYLMKTSSSHGNSNLYDHLSVVIKKILDHQPNDPLGNNDIV